ncbi:MAG TPA: hypothetical protein V6C86_13745 [Oculatellaceae cyanobacterium]
MNRYVALTITALGLSAMNTLVQPTEAEARKHYTVTQRQDQLKKEVDAGQKANELTLKEANALRDRLSSVAEDETKMKSKNGGKLSYKDEGKIEKKLNGISVDMQKQKLAKRVIPK